MGPAGHIAKPPNSVCRRQLLGWLATLCCVPLMTASTAGVDRSTLMRWAKLGRVVVVDRGIYIPADESDQDHLEVAAAVLRRPSSVVVLLSALHLHRLGTHLPQEVWLALPPGAANHRTGRPVHVLRWRPGFLAQDFETRSIAGVQVRVTTPARTISTAGAVPGTAPAKLRSRRSGMESPPASAALRSRTWRSDTG